MKPKKVPKPKNLPAHEKATKPDRTLKCLNQQEVGAKRTSRRPRNGASAPSCSNPTQPIRGDQVSLSPHFHHMTHGLSPHQMVQRILPIHDPILILNFATRARFMSPAAITAPTFLAMRPPLVSLPKLLLLLSPPELLRQARRLRFNGNGNGGGKLLLLSLPKPPLARARKLRSPLRWLPRPTGAWRSAAVLMCSSKISGWRKMYSPSTHDEGDYRLVRFIANHCGLRRDRARAIHDGLACESEISVYMYITVFPLWLL